MKNEILSKSSWILGQTRLAMTVIVTFSLIGIAALFLMPREEDPRLKNRFGFVQVVFPGATPEVLEQLVVRPIEERLREIDSIKKVETTIRPEGAGLYIELKDRVDEINEAWSLVEAALDRERPNLPGGVRELTLDKNSNAVENIVLAVTSQRDIPALELRRLTRLLRSELLREGLAQRVNLYGDPGEALNVVLREDALRLHGISPLQVAQSLRDASTSMPAGQLRTKSLELPLLTTAHVDSVSDLERLRVPKRSGGSVALESLGDVTEGVLDPPSSMARWNQKSAIVLGLVPPENINVVDLGSRIRENLKRFSEENPQIQIQEVAFAPDRTQARLDGLLLSLVQGISIVGIVLIFWMGWRLGLIVALSVPLISIIGLAIYFIGGGVLHQISLAAFVISLGQFIDNVIVVAESMQRRLDEGAQADEALQSVIREFSRPMLFATGTAIACFVPLLASEGASAEFTFAIPLIAVITLLVSYLVALVAVPIFSTRVLRPARQQISRVRWDERLAERLASWILVRPRRILSAAALLLLMSSLGFLAVKKEFFPAADRNELVAKFEFPDGQSFRETNIQMQRIELALSQHESVRSVTSFVGHGTPLFYYNLMPTGGASHISEMIITTRTHEENYQTMAKLRDFVHEQVPQVRLTVQVLEQGPPIKAPIELRLKGEDSEALRHLADLLVSELSEMEGTLDVRHDMGLGLVSLKMTANDTATASLGLGRSDLALGLLTRSNGVEIAKIGGQSETRPLRLRLAVKENEDVLRTPILESETGMIELGRVATAELQLTPSVIFRRNAVREVSVLANLQPGASFDRIRNQVDLKLPTLISEVEQASKRATNQYDKTDMKMPLRLDVQWGGQAEGAGEANLSVFRTIPFGLLLLLGCLLLEFNSFRKILVIFLSLPLAVVGVVPGLLIGDQPFGFMSLLGLLSLVGIVVNNAILIMESLLNGESEGLNFADSLRKTLQQRTRPILMTASLTIFGLLPLIFEASTLWPPLAWAMMTGLVASTILTLLVLPTLYGWIAQSPHRPSEVGRLAGKGILSRLWVGLVMCVLIFILSPHSAQATMTVYEVWQSAAASPSVRSDEMAAEVEQGKVDILERLVHRPRIQAEGQFIFRDRDRESLTPFGLQIYGQKRDTMGGVSVLQNLWVPEQDQGGLEAARLRSRSRKAQHAELRSNVGYQVAQLSVEHFRMMQTLRWMDSSLKNLRSQSQDVRRLSLMSRAGPSDELRMQVEIGSLEQERLKLLSDTERVKRQIQIYVPQFQLLSGWLDKNLQADVASRERERATDLLMRRMVDMLVKLDRADPSIRPEAEEIKLSWEAFGQDERAQKATWWPTLQVEGRWLYADQALLQTKQWGELTLKAQWPIYEGGTRVRAQALARIAAQAQEYRLDAHEREWRADRESVRAQIQSLQERSRWILDTEKLSGKALSMERQRLREGRLSLERYLEAERAALRLVRQRVDLEAEITLLDLRIRWLLFQEPQES